MAITYSVGDQGGRAGEEEMGMTSLGGVSKVRFVYGGCGQWKGDLGEGGGWEQDGVWWKRAETTHGWGCSYGHTVFHQAGPQVFIGPVQLGIPDLDVFFQGSQLLPELLQHSLGLRA